LRGGIPNKIVVCDYLWALGEMLWLFIITLNEVVLWFWEFNNN